MPKYKTVRRNDKGKLVYTYDTKQNRKYRQGSCIAHKRASARRHAQSKGLDFDLTTEYLRELWEKQKGKCKYSGRSLGTIGDGFDSPSIDRIDSTKGYVKGNVQWLCWGVNNMKNDMTEDFFLTLCKTIGDLCG